MDNWVANRWFLQAYIRSCDDNRNGRSQLGVNRSDLIGFIYVILKLYPLDMIVMI